MRMVSFELGFFLLVLCQSILMSIDELYFHRKRGLGFWETFGHPVDTAFFITPFLYSLLNSFNDKKLQTYIVIAILSSLIIVKDEWIHKKVCEGSENFIHALLFLIHSPILVFNGILWANNHQLFIARAVYVIGLFLVLIYQIAYWGAKLNGQHK